MNKYLAITATAGRHTLLERSVGMFLDQDYKDKHLLIWQNSPVYQELDQPHENVTLVNNHLNRRTGGRYKTLGEIYNDILDYIVNDPYLSTFDYVYHADDDDAFLPNHISEGDKGLSSGKYKAYKPEQSFYSYVGPSEHTGENIVKVVRTGNNMEPSIFVSLAHLQEYGYSDESVAHHIQWLSPLQVEQSISIDPTGEPTMIYDWGSSVPTFKTSGDPANVHNFENYHANSRDHGSGVIIPWSKSRLDLEFKRIFQNA